YTVQLIFDYVDYKSVCGGDTHKTKLSIYTSFMRISPRGHGTRVEEYMASRSMQNYRQNVIKVKIIDGTCEEKKIFFPNFSPHFFHSFIIQLPERLTHMSRRYF